MTDRQITHVEKKLVEVIDKISEKEASVDELEKIPGIVGALIALNAVSEKRGRQSRHGQYR